MKKIFTLFVLLALLGCSSSDESSQPAPANPNGSIIVDGQTYNFDKAKIIKNSTNSFSVWLSNATDTQTLYMQLEYNTTSSHDDLESTTFTYNSTSPYDIGFASFRKDINGSTYTTVFTQTDFVGAQCRVIVTKHNSTTYSFDSNFSTTLGAITSNYSGVVTKTGF